MPKNDIPTLPKLLHSFFHEWLIEQRNASHRTILAYRDAWRLFLRFVAQRRNKPVAALGLEHLTGADVLAFLQHIEQERRATVTTRNCRLAALRSFFSFVVEHEPRVALQCADVLRVPFKKTSRRATRYLESAEVSAILSQPDRGTVEGQRDHALMSLLYNTGARIQKVLDLRLQDVYFNWRSWACSANSTGTLPGELPAKWPGVLPARKQGAVRGARRTRKVPGSRSSELRPFPQPIGPPSHAPALALGEPLSMAKTAELIGCSPWTVRQTLIPRGLPHFRFKANGRLIFYRDQIIRWIQIQQGGKQ